MRSLNLKNNKQSGVALVTVLLVAAVTIALAYGALTVSLNTLQGSKAAESSVQARLNAESGLDAILARLVVRMKESDPPQSEEIIDEISDDISIITSSGQSPLEYVIRKGQKNGDLYIARVDGKGVREDTMYAVEASFEVNFSNTGPGNHGPGNGQPELFPVETAAVTASGQVVLQGSGAVTGDIYSKETITLSGGGGVVKGNIASLGSPNTTCNGPLPGNPDGVYKGVWFKGSAKVEGSVYSACDIIFNNWGATVSGNATAVNEIVPVSAQRSIHGHIPNYNPSNPVQPTVTAFEDPLNIDDFVSRFETATKNGRWSISGNDYWEIDATSGNGVSGVNRFDVSSVSALGKTHQVIRVDAFEMGGSATLKIRGHVTVFSDSTVELLGGGQIIIEDDSSLTIVSKGDVQFGIGISSDKADQLLVYSSTLGTIASSGHKKIAAGIYAPKADIKVDGSGGFEGALYGKHINISGSGTVNFDPILISVMTSEPSTPPVHGITRR